jgi:hypothetical protein
MFVAITLKVYACPVVKPETTIGEEAPTLVFTPQQANAVYVEITLPPVQEGAVNTTDTDVGPAFVAVPIVGASATFRALYPGKTIPA